MEVVAVVLGLAAILAIMVELGTFILVMMAVVVALNLLPGWVILIVVLGYVGLGMLRDRARIESHSCPVCHRPIVD